MSSSDSDSYNSCTEIVSEKIREAAKTISLDLLPKKSKQVYTLNYNAFKKWCKTNGTNSFCEDVLLTYFADISKTYAPSSLWATYSMLKSTIKAYNQIDISNYHRLISFLKQQHSGYKAKKSLVFTKENISDFLNNAPDELYLTTKVALIFGIAGAMRRQEFVNLKITDIVESEDMLFVKILETKNKIPRSFTITSGLYDICKQYLQARSQLSFGDRFFLKYARGKCEQQPIGINKFGTMPKEVALFLKLPNPQEYTGHSFRRTSATLLVDAGADITTLKRHGGWKSSTVAEGYIADSITNKKKICQQISSGIVLNKKARVAVEDSNAVTDSYNPRPLSFSTTVQECNTSAPKKIHQQLFKFQSLVTATSMSNEMQQCHRNIETDSVEIDEPSVQRNNNINVSKNLNTDTEHASKKTVEAPEEEQKFSILYDPDIGLYIYDLLKDDAHNTIQLYNCNVTIQSDSYKSIELYNCDVNKQC